MANEQLEEPAAKKVMSKTAAFRLYQLVDAKIARGGKLFLEDEKNKKAELLVL